MLKFIALTMCDYVLDQYVFLFLFLGMIVVLSVYPQAGKRKLTSLWVALTALLALSLADYFEYVLGNLTDPAEAGLTMNSLVTARTILSIFGYALRVFVVWSFFLVVVQDRRKRILTAIPCVLNALIYGTAIFSNAVFYISKENHFQSGTLWGGLLRYAVFFFAAFYCVLLFISSAQYFRQSDLEEGMLILICTTGCLGAGVVESFVGYRNLVVVCLAFSLIFYFLFIYLNSAKRDLLTDLLNRQTFYQDMTRKDDQITAVISVDMNELKYLNDNFGHEAGDEGLAAISKAMVSVLDRRTHLYRVGGDEFIALVLGMTEAEAENQMKRMAEAVEKTKYSCAFGIACRENRKQTVDDLVRIADGMMYQEKAEMKKNGILHMR